VIFKRLPVLALFLIVQQVQQFVLIVRSFRDIGTTVALELADLDALGRCFFGARRKLDDVEQPAASTSEGFSCPNGANFDWVASGNLSASQAWH
jgi:hypothetical protein